MTALSGPPDTQDAVVRLKNRAKALADEVRVELEVLESQKADLEATIKELRAMVRVWDPQAAPPPRKSKVTHGRNPPSARMQRRIATAIRALGQEEFTSADLRGVASDPSVSNSLKFLREQRQILGKVRVGRNSLVVYRILDEDAFERLLQGSED